MLTYICLSIALVILVITFVLAFKKRNSASKAITCIMVGIFLSTFFMMLPTEWVLKGENVFSNALYGGLSSLLYSFDALGGGQDIAQLETIALTGWVKTVYMIVNYVVFAAAPILTSSLILSFIGDIGERMRYTLTLSPKCYVFSQINKNSLILAKAIKQKNGKKTIVFCDTKDVDKEMIVDAKALGAILLYAPCTDLKLSRRFKKYEFLLISANEDDNIELAEAIIDKKNKFNQHEVTVNAFAESGTSINILEHLLKKEPCVVFDSLCEKTLENAKDVLFDEPNTKIAFCDTDNASDGCVEIAEAKGFDLLKKTWEQAKIDNNYKNYDITLKSLKENGDFDKTGLKVNKNRFTKTWVDDSLRIRFVDEIALFCNNLIFEHPLYNLPDGRKDISVMIVGCGRLGMRMLKTVAWCGQIDGYSLKICVYDKDAKKAEQQFLQQCPALSQYGIKFIEADIETADFENKIKDSLDATFVCVATGSDDLNLSVSEDLFRIFRRNNFKYTPPIFTRVRKSVKSVNLDKKGSYLSDRNIHLFGTAESMFSDNTLFNTKLDNLALAVHLCYCWALDKPNDSFEYRSALEAFYSSEYNRRSSMAVALHIASKLRSCGIINKNQTEPDLTDIAKFEKLIEEQEDVFESLAKNEHERWNAFVGSEGYRPADFETVIKYAKENRSHKDDASKLHPCILSWEELDDFQEKYDKLANELGLKKSDFKEYDKKIVKEIPLIIRKANQLSVTGFEFRHTNEEK